jgi:hypothetical protein
LASPAPIKLLGSETKLDDQIGRQVLRLDLAAFLRPKAEEGGFVIAHDDAGVRAANEVPPVCVAVCANLLFHD